jgi:hypothetical protein
VAGFAGEAMKTKVGRITALDPAGEFKGLLHTKRKLEGLFKKILTTIRIPV